MRQDSRPKSGSLLQLDLDRIRPNREQPRKAFDEVALTELATSMERDGVLQPVIVRPLGEGHYELIAGERRWRAAQIAGLLKVPALIREMDDQRVLEVALIENLQREDLNPVEAAEAFQTLIDDLGLTQQEVADRVGKQRTTVANMLRILNLPRQVQDRVRSGELSTAHAKLLLSVTNTQLQIKLADRIVKQGLTVRQLERGIKQATSTGSGSSKPAAPRDPNVEAAEQSLQRALGTKVAIVQGKQSGRIELHFYSHEEMERVYQLLMKASKTPE